MYGIQTAYPNQADKVEVVEEFIDPEHTENYITELK